MRAGEYVPQPGGYRAFFPAPLPPNPPIAMDDELWSLLSRADRTLGRLDGAAETVPNPDLFLAMYVRKEAVLSSQIEGTQASLIDVVEYELEGARRGQAADVGEVINYVAAMDYGLERLKELPLSLRLLREIHAKLIAGSRGGERNPGQFRTTQNWIGPPGSTLRTATFVPPPPPAMLQTLDNLEKFIHDETPMPLLIKCGLIHAQFETAHPFLDGNGRLGRLLITFFLCQQGILRQPLLYLSHYFKRYRAEYYDRLMTVRDSGDWEGWLRFFLKGVAEVSLQATDTARRIVALREQHRSLLLREMPATRAAEMLERLCLQPIVSVNKTAATLGLSYPAAGKLVKRLVELGILSEMTGGRRNRLFSYQAYLNAFTDDETAAASVLPDLGYGAGTARTKQRLAGTASGSLTR